MSVNNQDFVEWKEEFVSQERGSRVVHYFLKDSLGDSVLAVVGTERSLRHMVYVVAKEFLNFCGSDRSINASFKWRSRREVVDWLTSMLSKQQHSSQDHPKSPPYSLTKKLSTELPVNGIDIVGTCTNGHKGHFARNLTDQNWEIVWSGAAWSCGKQLKHYQAFCRNGTTIAIHSFVLVMAKEENHYLAYLEDMYEDKKGQKKVKVRWFHQSQEVFGKIPPPTPHPREVFITPYAQVISAECVDGLAAVLTAEHYEKWSSCLPHTASHRTYMCFRQFRNNKIKPFNLNKLRGYYDQSIFSSTNFHAASGKRKGEENNGSLKRGSKRSRTCKGIQKITMAQSDGNNLEHGRQIMASGQDHQVLRHWLPERPLAVKYPCPQYWFPSTFKVGDKIELLCQDSGIRGCWFRCTVLQILRKRLKVLYEDIQNEDGCGYLEEWIPAFRSATPEKLGMRCSGRLTVRPCPPNKKFNDGVIEIGTAVDAWWNDGWWEGVVAGIGSEGDDTLQVYFPGEDVFLIAQRRNLRISRDWIGNRWIDIGVKQDILSAISAVRPSTKLSSCKVVESGGSAVSEHEVPAQPGHESLEEKQGLAGFAASNGPVGNPKEVDPMKPQLCEAEILREDNDGGGGGGGGGGDRGSISAQCVDVSDDVDRDLVCEVDRGTACQTCEVIAAEA